MASIDSLGHMSESMVRELTRQITTTCLSCPNLLMNSGMEPDLIKDEHRFSASASCKIHFDGMVNPKCPDGADPRRRVAKDLGLQREISTNTYQVNRVITGMDLAGSNALPDDKQINQAIAQAVKEIVEDRHRDTFGWGEVLTQFNPEESRKPTEWWGEMMQDWSMARAEFFEEHEMPTRRHPAGDWDLVKPATPYMVKHLKVDEDFLMTLPSAPPTETLRVVSEVKRKQKEVEPTYHNWATWG